jgi:hypothetical protein
MENVMKLGAVTRSGSRILGWLTISAIVVLTMAVWSVPRAQAQADDASRILKAMSDFVASQRTISITFDADIEVITPAIQKIQFTNSGTVLLSRPDKLRATRTGGYADVELAFDGKTVSIFSKDNNAFTQIDAPGTVDQLIHRLRADYSVTAPGADMLLSNVFDELMDDVIDAKHIGFGVIDGVECTHLAFRTTEVDWQIWIEVGARPIPRKYVITSKSIAAAPQYTLRIKEWRTDVQANADNFVFRPPQGATKVAADEFPRVDEVPPGVVMGGVK